MQSLKQFPLSRTQFIIYRDIGTVVLRKMGSWIISSEFSRIPWKSSELGGSDQSSSGDGFTWGADPRLIEKLINILNLSGGKGARTPAGKDIGRDVRDSDGELEYSDAKLVQAAVPKEEENQAAPPNRRQGRKAAPPTG